MLDLSPLKDKLILFSGASGFIGSWMLEILNQSGVNCDVRYYNRQSEKELKCFMPDVDYMVHLAPIDASLPLMVMAKKTLLASSGAVYDKEPNEYGLQKRENEAALHDSGLPYVSARIFTTYGPRMKPYFALSSFIRNGIKKKPLVVMGGGSAWRSYMYASDVAEWLWTLLIKGNGTYDVGSEEGITIKELAKKVAHCFIPTSEVIYDGKSFVDPRPFYLPDTSKARKLGLACKMPLDMGLEKTIEWMKNEN